MNSDFDGEESDVVQIYFTTTPPAVTVFSEVDEAARVSPKMALHWEAPDVTDHVAEDLVYDLQEEVDNCGTKNIFCIDDDCVTDDAVDCRD